jgi:hypothetical protein
MTNHCGECTACCRVFAIAELPEKKAGDWCQHCAIGKGCKIYEQRPPTCAEFQCLWLISQSRGGAERMEPELRPDRCKVVFSPSTNEMIMAGTVMPGSPLAWQRPDVLRLIKAMTRHGMGVVVGTPGATRRTMLDKDGMHEVRLTEPDENGMQYNIQEEQHDDT